MNDEEIRAMAARYFPPMFNPSSTANCELAIRAALAESAAPGQYASGLKKAMQICQDHPEARASYIYESIRAEEIKLDAAKEKS